MSIRALDFSYGSMLALNQINMDILSNHVTALIGPSGCGKSTFLRCLNRMNDRIPNVHIKGQVLFKGQDIYEQDFDRTELRRRVGMVFQKPNPFPKSIFENVAFGLRMLQMADSKAELEIHVQQRLEQVGLWDDLKDHLAEEALGLSLGEQQRLCLARVLAVQPEVILMDEPASALDPIATERLEELIDHLKQEFTIVIVTHNMQQAARISDYTGFFWLGELIEFNPTTRLFTNPEQTLTETYITGRMG